MKNHALNKIVGFVFAVYLTGICSGIAQASETKVPVGSQNAVNAGSVSQLIVGMVVVIGAILALAWMSRRMGVARTQAHIPMKVLSGLNLGAKEKLLVVDVAGQQFLIGVTSASINGIHQFDEALVPAIQDEPSADKASKEIRGGGDSFASRLHQMMKQGATS